MPCSETVALVVCCLAQSLAAAADQPSKALRGSAAQVQAVPDWCKSVPAEYRGAACSGAGRSCECAGECKQSPASSWKQNPRCCGCAGATSLAELGAVSLESVQAVPDWCKSVPAQYRGVACSGTGRSCECASECKQSPTSSWKQNPRCCGCAGAMSLAELGAASLASVQAVPDWCKDVPAQYRGVACSGTGRSCECAGECKQSPASSWKQNPQCCGCAGAMSLTELGATSLESVQAVPDWCKNVPVQYRGVACSGTGRSCECAGECKQSPTSSWKQNPRCCGCSGAMALAELGAVSLESVPDWCKYVPDEYKDSACPRTAAAGQQAALAMPDVNNGTNATTNGTYATAP